MVKSTNIFRKVKIRKALIVLLAIIVVITPLLFTNLTHAQAASTITSNSIQPSDGRPSGAGAGTNVTYTISFTFPDATGTVSCIQIPFGTTSALSTPATGMTTNTAGSLTGGGLTVGNWTDVGSTNGTLQLDIAANTANTHTATAVTLTLTGVTNTTIANPTNVFAQINVYPISNGSHVCSGTVAYQSPVMALTYTSGVSMTASIDPSLSLTVADAGTTFSNGDSTGTNKTSTATTIPFGTLTPATLYYTTQTLTAATNAAHGYNLYINDTAQLKDNNNDTFTDQSGTIGSTAAYSGSSTTSSIGITADGSVVFGTSPTKFAAIPQTATAISTRSTAQSADVTHVEYKIEASNTQPPGAYSTTVVYTAVPTY